MSDLELLIKGVSDVLKALSQGMDSMADRLNEFAGQVQKDKAASADPADQKAPKQKAKPGRKPKEKPAADAAAESPAEAAAEPAKKTRAKTKAPRALRGRRRIVRSGKEKAGFTAAVLELIAASPEGATVKELRSKTDFDSVKIQNILFRLKRQGKIKNADKGRYILA